MSSQLTKYYFTEVSKKQFCAVCGKGLKLNLLQKKPKAKYCYKHYLAKIAEDKAKKNERPKY